MELYIFKLIKHFLETICLRVMQFVALPFSIWFEINPLSALTYLSAS